MRRANAADRVDARGIVEQHATAAVDLAVDETRQQIISAKIARVRIEHARIRVRDDRCDDALVDQHRDIVAETIDRQHACVDERRRHHTVSVTLLRCGGASGLRPRRTASAFTAV